MTAHDVTCPYRIGGGPRRARHWAHRWHADLWFRSWQAENETCRFARRAWTARGARRKTRRDLWFAQHGRRSFHQWRRETFA